MSSSPHSSEPRSPAAAGAPLDRAQIALALGAALEPVLSSRRTAAPAAEAISALPRSQQDFALHWIGVVARTNVELAFQLAAAAPEAIVLLGEATAEAWIIHALDVYDRDGLHLGSQVFRAPEAFANPIRTAAAVVRLDDVARVLELFVRALQGRRVSIDTAPCAYSDSERLYLPPRIVQRADRDENFLLYKAATALLWAQGRYGTFDADLDEACADFDDTERALTLLNALETIRLEACIARALPGLGREMAGLHGAAVADARCAVLLDPSATVRDSIALMRVLYADLPALASPYPTVLRPEEVRTVRRARLAREKAQFGAALAHLLDSDSAGARDAARRFSIEPAGETTDDYILKRDGIPLAPPAELDRLIASIRQDLHEIPDDYLIPTGRAGDADERTAPAAGDTGEGADPIPPYSYDEWDYQRRHYRRNWCELREMPIDPGDPAFHETTVLKYAPQIAQLKRTFERLRADERTLKRQSEGDGIDLDALIEASVDMRNGAELAPLVFTRRVRAERDLAVMFMVDMSGSTRGWVNDAEREALVMLCEALQMLGDRYAIYGFSGVTRKHCEVFRVKGFDEAYGPTVSGRIAGIRPQDYTRMGAAIRHLTMLLRAVDARTRVLITLSDGKPDDYSDNYRGRYGIEDTHQALVEAQRAGIRPFCITIDHDGRDYLPPLYGNVNWILVDDVKRLPLKLADIYRRITT